MRAPVSIARRYIGQRLMAATALTDLLDTVDGMPAVFPVLAPAEDLTLPHITHTHVAWQTTVTMAGKPTIWEALWDVSIWAPGWDDQVLILPEAEMLAAMLGPDLAAINDVHVVAGAVSAFVSLAIQDPVPANGEFEATGAWQRVAHRFKVTVR